MKNKLKKYCLIETGKIEPCYFDNGEPRMIYEDKEGEWYLEHDCFYSWGIAYAKHRILKFADTIKELKEK